MKRRVALLLTKDDNPYQLTLVTDATEAARRLDLELLPPVFAANSAVEQVAALFTFHRQKVDGYVILPVVPDMLTSVALTILKGGASIVFLNRPPYELPRLREQNPKALVAAAYADQHAMGRLQGEQCRRLLPQGGNLVLIEGPVEAPQVHERRAGLIEALGPKFRVHSLEGRWDADLAERALTSWLQSGGRTASKLDLVVCQNDDMAAGARQALHEASRQANLTHLQRVPITGIDGLADDGQRRVRAGTLTATIENPRSTGPALELLARFWKTGERVERQLLELRSHPALEQLAPSSSAVSQQRT